MSRRDQIRLSEAELRELLDIGKSRLRSN